MNTNSTTVLLIILLSSLTFSCKKDPINPANDLTGQWQWLSTYAVYPLSDSNPLTPQNTGIQEILVFNANYTWVKTENGIRIDSGIYSLGHGSYTPYPGAYIFIYDSIAYYQNGIRLNVGDYYDIYNDTLQFCPYYAGRFSSLSLPFNGSKFWIKK